MTKKRKLITLVALETLTPYRAGEVFSVDEETAEKLLTPNRDKTDFGPKYPRVKVRKFDPRVDGERLLEERSLNIEAHNALQAKLRPTLPAVEKVSGDFTSAASKLLEEAGYTGEDNSIAERDATTPAPRKAAPKQD